MCVIGHYFMLFNIGSTFLFLFFVCVCVCVVYAL